MPGEARRQEEGTSGAPNEGFWGLTISELLQKFASSDKGNARFWGNEAVYTLRSSRSLLKDAQTHAAGLTGSEPSETRQVLRKRRQVMITVM